MAVTSLISTAAHPVHVHETLSDGVEDGPGTVVDVQLLVDVGDVVPDRLLGDREGAGRLLALG
ncbi:hypothetical protein [Rubrobacter marinus]|nr:hypothetical protein [Rubrobacter marinus]